MQKADEQSSGDRLGQQDREGGAAIRFVVMAALWVSTCPGPGVDTVACGAPQRAMLACGGPLILFAGGLWAFLRTYRVWRNEGTWWGWHGAGWFLLTLTALTVSMGVPAIAGPVLAL